jgi:hypothetical protein
MGPRRRDERTVDEGNDVLRDERDALSEGKGVLDRP